MQRPFFKRYMFQLYNLKRVLTVSKLTNYINSFVLAFSNNIRYLYIYLASLLYFIDMIFISKSALVI